MSGPAVAAAPGLAIVGAGGLGSALGLVALLDGLVSPAGLLLVDQAPGRAAGAALDLDDAAAAAGLGRGVRGGSDIALLRGATRVVVCAGYPPAVGCSAELLAQANCAIGRLLGEALGELAPGALVLVASRPAAAVAAALAAASGLPPAQVVPAWDEAAEAREEELAAVGGSGTARFGAATRLVRLLRALSAPTPGGR